MVEQRAARNNREFISSSGEAIALLDEFDRAVSELEGVCAALETELGAARPAAGAFVDEHDRLTGELKRNARQTELVGDFLRDYQLTPAEISALTGGGIQRKSPRSVAPPPASCLLGHCVRHELLKTSASGRPYSMASACMIPWHLVASLVIVN